MEILGLFYAGGYLIVAILMGLLGTEKTCGFFGAFGASLFFTPFGGLIALCTSVDKKRQKRLDKIAEYQLKEYNEKYR